jgi:hypothetical protein
MLTMVMCDPDRGRDEASSTRGPAVTERQYLTPWECWLDPAVELPDLAEEPQAAIARAQLRATSAIDSPSLRLPGGVPPPALCMSSASSTMLGSSA